MARPPPHLARAVVSIIDRFQRHLDPARAIDVAATALERHGDPEGAALVRATRPAPVADGSGFRRLEMGTTAMRLQEGTGQFVQWYTPSSCTETLQLTPTEAATFDRWCVELTHSGHFLSAGIDAPTRALFVGPSGTGKTLAARAVGARLGLPVAVAILDRLVGQFLGDSARNLRAMLDATSEAPCVLFLDELDAITAVRGSGDGQAGSAEMERGTSALLQMLDVLPPDQIVIAATNLPEAIDPALGRRLPLRFDFGMPDTAARMAMTEAWLAKAEGSTSTAFRSLYSGHADLWRRLVDDAEGKSGADLRTTIMSMARSLLLADL